MKHYLKDGILWAFEADGSQDHLITGDMVPLSDEELEALRAPPPPEPPSVVSMRQARLALLDAGLLASVDAAVAAMPGVEGDAARIEWEYATTVDRHSPLVFGLTIALGLTEGQLTALFTQAATL